jgi:PAS domain-containing protein
MNMRGELLGSPIDGEAFAYIRRRLSALATLLDAPFGGRRMQSLIRGAPVTFRVLGEEGQWMNTPCLGWSISELTQAEEALALLAAIVASSDDAIVSKSLEGVILSWNAGRSDCSGIPLRRP